MDKKLEASECHLELDTLFNPRSIAVIGASSGFAKWGQLVLTNILAGDFQGKVFPVNPREERLCGLTVRRRIQDIEEAVDMALVSTPAETVPGVLMACAEKGVKGIVLITSGFSETDEAGRRLERDVVSICTRKGLTLIGPNTMGIIRPGARLFATGAHTRPRDGSVGFISQSGNLGVQLIHWAVEQGIGVSLFVGSGNEAMLSCTDYLAFLSRDPKTKIVVLYLESVGDGRRFLELAWKVNLEKPLIVLKLSLIHI